MPDKVSEEVSTWQERILQAKRYLEKDSRLRLWREYRGWYNNKYPTGVISVNLIFGIGRALLPQLYFKSPTIINVPRKNGIDRQAKILDSIDQWIIQHIGMKYQIKLGLLDSYLTNLGVFKFGYHSISTELPNQGSQGTEVPAQLQLALAELLGPIAQQQEEEERPWNYHDFIKPNSPWMLRVQPEDFLVPFKTRDIYSAPWCAFRVVRHIDDVKADPNYSNTKELEPNVSINDESPIASPTERGEVIAQEDGLEYYEIWDKRDGTIKVVVDGHEKYLRNDKHNLPIDGLPVEVIQFNPTGWDFWGTSDAAQIEKQVIEYNETRTLEILHKRTAVTKFIYDAGLIKDSEIAKFTKGEIAAIAADGNPVGSVVAITPNMSRDLFAISDVIRDDIREVLGVSRNQTAEFDVSRRTATEAAIVQQAMQLRADERRDQVADFISAAFQRKIHPMIFDQWTEERTIEVTALGGWFKYTGPQIKGDYDVVATPDSVLPLTKAQKQQAAQTIFASFKGDPRINQRALYDFVLSQYEGVVPENLLLSEDDYDKVVQAMQEQADRESKMNIIRGNK